jgi:hypothetical protein
LSTKHYLHIRRGEPWWSPNVAATPSKELPLRRIVQIAVDPAFTSDQTSIIYALCNDGSIWWREASDDDTWHQISAIPQDEGAPSIDLSSMSDDELSRLDRAVFGELVRRITPNG